VQVRGANGSAAGRVARGVKKRSAAFCGAVRFGASPCRSAASTPRSETILSAKGVGHGNLAPRLGDRVVMAFARYSAKRTRDRQIECRAGGAAFRRPRTVLVFQYAVGDTPPIATEAVIRLVGALPILRHEAGSPQLPWSAATDCAPPLPIAARLVRPRSSDCAARPVVLSPSGATWRRRSSDCAARLVVFGAPFPIARRLVRPRLFRLRGKTGAVPLFPRPLGESGRHKTGGIPARRHSNGFVDLDDPDGLPVLGPVLD